MNAPLPEDVRRALETVTLDDKYALQHGRAFMSGVQALVRLPMLQRQRDAAAGLNTAGFISGYRGSPLGGYDQALWAAKKHLESNNIVFQPGVNEELGATAVWGTQQLDLYPETKKFDGVFGLWYGKGPGVDRCSDVFKHANMAGTARHGGVIALAGDDHISKSSTAAHQSDHIFKACGTPVFFPSNVQDILDMGLHAFAMSRFSGLWSGMKTIQEVVESSASVSVEPDRVNIILPEDFQMPPGGLHIRWPDAPLEQEQRLMNYKWYAALAYVRANRLNHNVIDGPNDRFGLIASGKAYNDMRQALADLGLDDDTCRQLGIRVHKVNVVWPLEATITRDFARGLQEILVVEEKRQVIEYQIKEELYNWRSDVRPNVVGKFSDEHGGEWSVPNPSQDWLGRPPSGPTPGPPPPQWLVSEVHQRLVLFLNHVLMQEKEAMERLVRQKGRVARVQWRGYSMALQITPAGLFNVAPEGAQPDLLLEVTETSPLALAQVALRGDKPSIRIEGDVQLAADINWLVDHVEWDVEEDLARIIGDAPAHTVAKVARSAAQALRQFVGARMAGKPDADAPAPEAARAAAPASAPIGSPVVSLPGFENDKP